LTWAASFVARARHDAAPDRSGPTVAFVLIHPGALFADAARRFSERDALDDGTTYRALAADVAKLAAALSELGLEPGDRVGVLSHNRPELVVVWLALERAGLIRVVLHTHFETDVHGEMLRRTGARALVFDTRFAAVPAAVAGALSAHPILIGLGSGCPSEAVSFEDLCASAGESFGAPEVDENDPVCIQPTTGTTGPPKPWVVSHRAWTTLVLHNTMHLAAMAPFGEDEVNLHAHALQWASGAQTLLPYLLNGARTSLIDDQVFEPRAVADAIEDRCASGVLLPGPMLAPVLDAIESRGGFSHRLRRLVTLFAPPELLARATRMLGPIWCHAYGSTEQGAPATRLLAPEAAARPTSVGRAASPLIEVRVLDEHGTELAAGRVGEIAVRSPMSCGRYWQDAQLTTDAFHPGGWFRSGDLGSLDDDGFLTYVDRARDAISTPSGIVYPHEVEAAVLSHPAVAHCGAVGLREPPAQHVVVAAMLKPDAHASTADLAASAGALGIDVSVMIVEQLPMVLGGAKVQRDVLREQLLEAGA
jgi:acyl-coenzyme A synthetase/AMP-(fatty) acid ligase